MSKLIRASLEKLREDPRHYQLGMLSGLLIYGLSQLAFDIDLTQCAVTILAALSTQLLCGRLVGLSRFEWKSALISSLSLCLLLRTNHLAVAALGAALAIALKFAVRVKGKHVFNPTGGALFFLLLADAPMWISPGQWGSAAVLAFFVAGLGGVVVHRAARSDVTLAFMGFYAALLFGRSLYLGEPMSIPLHRLENGALLLFTFFMISDPKTTPDARAGRILYALLVAVGAYVVHFVLFRTNGLIWSLGACAVFVPLIDVLLPGARYAWNHPGGDARPRAEPLVNDLLPSR